MEHALPIYKELRIHYTIGSKPYVFNRVHKNGELVYYEQYTYLGNYFF